MNGAWAPITTEISMPVYSNRKSVKVLHMPAEQIADLVITSWSNVSPMMSKNHLVCCLHAAVWLPIALGVGDLYINEYTDVAVRGSR